MTTRRQELKEWAVRNLDKWPTWFETYFIDTDEINAYFDVPFGDKRQLPVLHCRLGGGCVDSFDWFYARKKSREKSNELSSPAAEGSPSGARG